MPEPWDPILVPSSENWAPRGGTRSGGQSFEGEETVVASPTARWKASLTIPCFTPERVRAMRRVIALGRAQTWRVGPCEATRAPWFVDPLTGGRITYGWGAKDAAIDPAFETNPDTASTLDFQTAGAVAMNATAMTIQRNRGGLLEPGMIFSVGNRLHIITALTTADPGADAGYAAAGQIGIHFRPWLRADYLAGTPIEFGRPLGTMGFATDDTGAMELQLSRLGTVTLDLVEKF